MRAERQWRVATRVCVVIVGVLFVVLAVTGIMLSFRYRPDHAQLIGGPVHRMTERRLHAATAAVFLPAVVALLCCATAGALAGRQRRSIVLIVATALAALALSFTGYLLPWDQLALRVVTVGSNIRGYGTIIRGHDVKWVLVGRHEIGTASFTHWFWAHTIALPLVFVALVLAMVLTTHSEQTLGRQVGAGAQSPELLPYD